ncbi:hypothetical protein SLE2022_065300 [Rubroshorea leprosula]
MEAIKPVSRVSSSQIAFPLSSGKRTIHCRRYMMLSSSERQIRIRIQHLKQHQVPRAVGCVAPDPGLVAELEQEQEDENIEERLGQRGRGVVELLECLEKEAIMGEDQGRDPTNYNRRAQIFDKSSEVFQALKEQGQQQDKNCQS